MGTRKSASRLTADERSRFVGAVKGLKASGVYDRFVRIHAKAMMDITPDPAHGGPAFLPWHREYLRRLELALQKVDPAVTIPYWDWTRQRALGQAPFTADLMGGNGRPGDGMVTTGPFAAAGWQIVVREMADMPSYLTRFMGSGASLPTATAVDLILARVPYDARPWSFDTDPARSFRASLENGPHNFVHNWVGGNMGMASSPNDPLFFLHHAMIDRLWAVWQKRHPGEPYRPASGGPLGHNLDDPMWPWRGLAVPPTPRSTLDHHALGYRYDDEALW